MGGYRGVDTGPVRRLLDPDGRLGRGNGSIVQRAPTYENKMRTFFRFADQGRAAGGAKTPAHVIAALCRVCVPGNFAFEVQRIGWEADVHGRAAGAEILA